MYSNCICVSTQETYSQDVYEFNIYRDFIYIHSAIYSYTDICKYILHINIYLHIYTKLPLW